MAHYVVTMYVLRKHQQRY